jgi:hypothetical protein
VPGDRKSLIWLVRPPRLERGTFGFGGIVLRQLDCPATRPANPWERRYRSASLLANAMAGFIPFAACRAFGRAFALVSGYADDPCPDAEA